MDRYRTPYPPIEPYDSGLLDVGDGNHIWYECSGNPNGKPVLFIHGGPGGGTKPQHRCMFNPLAYRIILVDQRGCGRSVPHLADGGSLEHNTTWHLVGDFEKLRDHLRIQRWMLFGGSWGSTLALAYAQKHPHRVTEMVLRGIFLTRPSELSWMYGGGAGQLFPEEWERFEQLIPLGQRGIGSDYIPQYGEMLRSADPSVALAAARAWTRWELRTSALVPAEEKLRSEESDRFAVAFANIENHYFRHHAFLAPNQLLEEVGLLRDIPAIMVQGRYDVVCPPRSAWELHKAWPGSELHIVNDAGHSMAEPGITDRLIVATDTFR